VNWLFIGLVHHFSIFYQKNIVFMQNTGNYIKKNSTASVEFFKNIKGVTLTEGTKAFYEREDVCIPIHIIDVYWVNGRGFDKMGSGLFCKILKKNQLL
jgi:hypothetical protein